MPYDAFISYYHGLDKDLALAVQSGLQKLAKPWYRRRALRVFRDDANLSASPELWGSIRNALDDSRYLILLASPGSAQSEWVNRETDHWRQTKLAGRILLVVTAGTLAWDPAHGDFSRKSDAVPNSLRGTFVSEPLYIDLRDLRAVDALSLRHSAFRNAIATIAAPIHNKDKDALESEDLRLHRRAVRTAVLAVVLLALLTVATSIASLLAVRYAKRADQRARLAIARQLAAEALNMKDQRLDLSLLLSLEGLKTWPTPEGTASLLTTLQSQPRLLSYFRGHSEIVQDVAFSPNGHLIVSAGDDGNLVFWDLDSGEPAVFEERRSGFTAVAFQPNGFHLAAANRDGTVTLWDLSDPESDSLSLSATQGPVFDIAFHPTGSFLASGGGDGTLVLWDVRVRKILHRMGEPSNKAEQGVWSIAFRGDGEVIAAARLNGQVSLWNMKNGRLLKDPPFTANAPGSISFGGNGQLLASNLPDGRILLWNSSEKTDSKKLGESPVSSNLDQLVGGLKVEFSPNGKLLATANYDRTVLLWDVETLNPLDKPLFGHRAAIWSAAFSPNGKFLATGDGQGTIIVWGIEGQRGLGTLLANTASSFVVAFSPQGLLASGNSDGSIVLWDPDEGIPLMGPLTGHEGQVTGLDFNLDGRFLASVDVDGNAILWDLSEQLPHGSKLGTPVASFLSVAFSPNSDLLALGGAVASGDTVKGAILFWSVDPLGQLGEPLYAHDIVYGLDFGTDGSTLASVGSDGTARLWDVASRSERFRAVGDEWGNAYDVSLHPDGHVIAVARSAPEVALWDFAERKAPFEPLVGHRDAVFAVSFHPRGHTLASASLDGTIRLWDVARGQPLGSPLVGPSSTFDVTYSHDGKRLASAAAAGIMVWNLDEEYLAKLACHVANRNLSRWEWDAYIGKVRPYQCTFPSLPIGDGVDEDASNVRIVGSDLHKQLKENANLSK